MRAVAYACAVFGSLLSIWALVDLLAWWAIPSWHVNREPIIVAFFLLVAAVPCMLLTPALAIANRAKWPRHLIFVSWAVLGLGVVTFVVWWITNGSPT